MKSVLVSKRNERFGDVFICTQHSIPLPPLSSLLSPSVPPFIHNTPPPLHQGSTTAEENEIVDLTQRLLNVIGDKDYQEYVLVGGTERERERGRDRGRERGTERGREIGRERGRDRGSKVESRGENSIIVQLRGL